MAITKIIIGEECTACGLCEDICPEVFTVDDISIVSTDVDFAEYEDQIKQAVEECPVEVISIEES